MHEINFSDYCNDTTLCGIIEPLKEGDKVYILTKDGKLYKWDDTVVSVTNEYLTHFKEVSDIDCAEVAVESVVEPSVEAVESSFDEIVARVAAELNVKYESNSKNPFKTESYLLDYFEEHCDVFPNNWEKVTIQDNIYSIVNWIINVNKSAVMHFIPDEYKDLQDNRSIKQVLTSIIILSLKDDKVNKLIAIVKAVKDYCDNLKAAKESKIQSDKENKKPTDKEEKKQAVEEKKKSDES